MTRPRITVAHLEALIARLNRTTGSPAEPYTLHADGRYRANIGAYHLSRQYGGFSLHRIVTDGGGVSSPLTSGHIPARELADRMHAFLSGLEAALAEPVQEPVAWGCFKDGELQSELVGTKTDVDFWVASDEPHMQGMVAGPLYTTLRAALAEREEDRADELTVAYMMGAHSKLRTLTDEVIADLWYQNGTHHHFARAIERYLKGEK